MTRVSESRRRALRVAVASAALVAVAVAVVSFVVDVVVIHAQLEHVDARLTTAMRAFAGTGQLPGGPPSITDAEQRELSVPLVVWVVESDGRVIAQTDHAPPLPPSVQNISQPSTVHLGAVDFRVTATSAAIRGSSFFIVVGQSLAITEASRDSLVATELWLAPLLVVVSGVGAFFVGMRTAGPIELSRQQQIAFAADASHELRTPLAVIEAETALALNKARTKVELTQTVERVSAEALRLRHIVDSLLWLARVDADEAPQRAEPIDIAGLAQSAVQRFQPVAERRNVTLICEGDAEAAVVLAPPEWADRLMGVLLDNACKFAGDGGTVRVGVLAASNTVGLSVEDSGPGIPAEERSQIFNRFHRSVASEAGAGLGLAIGDVVVTATHGRWTVEDSELGGARIAVSWPRAAV